jgi:hypothetical protein
MTSWEKRGGEPAGFLSLPRVSAWPEVNRGSLKLKPKAAQGEARLLSARLRVKMRRELLKVQAGSGVPVSSSAMTRTMWRPWWSISPAAFSGSCPA